MDIRKEYLDFFKSKGHEIIASAPLVPDDATLLFTNAGMVPFKSIFTGDVPRPNPPIRTSCQTCIRAGGKHNDLDNVGYTARHHTFFEMLGNFSFGEYFKKDAISYAWEFVTEVLKLPKDKLYVTVHEKDDEAYELWQKFIQKDRIYRFGDKDNFWAMGDTGPCGPCSEIFYDQGSEHFNSDEDYMGGDGDRFLEIWNLVFMQFERSKDGTMTPLPKPSIDTGMGLERVTAIKEDKFSNYDSSLFMPLINEVAKLCHKQYEYKTGASYRVISDHIRSVTFLLAQGVNFDKEGRGYVLRRILRRAVRHGYLLGIKEPFMYKLVDKVVELMGEHYSYLKEKKEYVKELIKLEEERFLATIVAGLDLFNEELAKTSSNVFSGEVAFKLYDTYGFPLDLTADMLREKGLSVDEAKFDALMNEQKARAKASWKGSGDAAKESGDFKTLLEEFGENKFIGYDNLKSSSKVLALLNSEFKRVNELKNGEIGYVMLDSTPFYAQSGGQCGDTGMLGENQALDTKKYFGLNLSMIEAKNSIKIGDIVLCEVSLNRLEIRRHHSATHLLQAALRNVLGAHIAQAGSSVEADKLRFDFSHPKPVTKEELEKIENFVNEAILKGAPAKIEIMDIQNAKKSGAIALFGEKYADKVRVLTLGPSKELCGGTHVENLNEIGSFFIVRESGVSAGVRRIEAVCSKAALELSKEFRKEINDIKDSLKGADPLLSIKKLKDEIKSLQNDLKNASNTKDLDVKDINGVKVVVSKFDGDIKSKIDELKNKFDKVVVFLAGVKDGKVSLGSGSKNTSIKAGELVKTVAPIVGGGGGGRDDFATAGGKDESKIDEALNAATKFISEKL
ncbi:TPA: alanine--tRNA ligase [Campylobacter fetus subsp. venerealis]|uniref:Alanine--tRNA ligase n=1 Tax=Campylobacter fetus subsp. venerealis NCTC 10354 TaxID=983328 RepID=A0AAE6MA15_CAMFE|nr:alanine--tRNA ligase [Campylobacter fetus]OCS22147.1 alanine--tRNA ligase [Campylobacter fetus subsp. venerealis cfvi97/532]OCS26731.1 alanine--tRNA ligase [Campylobacter fetus subsp. venerealis cfvB10]OCS30563.1 alanine--tRNA ligase [Campylobacter fetus subsp. venerealis LMG 6570 = CCUG 33900]OCS43080.1 alanine--tRNA ligase [Campylobacter fetus subsp. venerealis cfvi02/298]AHE94296.1 alanyl-tRNA synthetase [Campylobacter fetus subsp. venerealis cfvi03/293]